MPPLSATNAQRLIVLSVRDITDQADPDYAGVLAANVATYWAGNATHGLLSPTLGPDLQYYYTQRDCVTLALGAVRDLVDLASAADQKATLNQLTIHLRAMYDAATAEITRLETIIAASRPALMGQMAATVAPFPPIVVIDPATGRLLPSPDNYRGSPYSYPYPYRRFP